MTTTGQKVLQKMIYFFTLMIGGLSKEKLTCTEAGTKVGPDQLGTPVRVGLTRTNLDRIKK